MTSRVNYARVERKIISEKQIKVEKENNALMKVLTRQKLNVLRRDRISILLKRDDLELKERHFLLKCLKWLSVDSQRIGGKLTYAKLKAIEASIMEKDRKPEEKAESQKRIRNYRTQIVYPDWMTNRSLLPKRPPMKIAK